MSPKTSASVTVTALLWVGMILMLAGAFVSVSGLVVGRAVVEISFRGAKVSIQETGLAILAAGAILCGIVAFRLPKGVGVFAGSDLSFSQKVADKGQPLFFGIAVAAIILLALSLLS